MTACVDFAARRRRLGARTRPGKGESGTGNSSVNANHCIYQRRATNAGKNRPLRTVNGILFVRTALSFIEFNQDLVEVFKPLEEQEISRCGETPIGAGHLLRSTTMTD